MSSLQSIISNMVSTDTAKQGKDPVGCGWSTALPVTQEAEKQLREEISRRTHRSSTGHPLSVTAIVDLS